MNPHFSWTHFLSVCSVFTKQEHCLLPGSVQGQAGWGSEQPGLVEDVPACGMGVGTRWTIRSLPNQTILLFYDSMWYLYSQMPSTTFFKMYCAR